MMATARGSAMNTIDGYRFDGLQGAARYGLLNIPQPVAGADADFNRAITLDEFRQRRIAPVPAARQQAGGPNHAAGTRSAPADPPKGRAAPSDARMRSIRALAFRFPRVNSVAAPSRGQLSVQLYAPPGILTVSVPSSSVSMIWQASREVRVTCQARSSRSSSSSLAGGSRRNPPVDDHMAGRAGHLPLAGALERLARAPGRRRADGARGRLDLLVEAPVGLQEPHLGHAGSTCWARAASSIRRQRRGQLFLAGVAAEAEADRGARLAVVRPSARSTWLGRPEPLAQADPSEKAMSRSSEISRAPSSPSRRMLRLPR